MFLCRIGLCPSEILIEIFLFPFQLTHFLFAILIGGSQLAFLCEVVLGSGLLYRVDGKTVLIGDGVKQSKEAYHMPGVKKLHQDSEDSSKGEYIFGHLFGAVGAVIAKSNRFFCIPLKINI